jgi:hypothetical protein
VYHLHIASLPRSWVICHPEHQNTKSPSVPPCNRLPGPRSGLVKLITGYNEIVSIPATNLVTFIVSIAGIGNSIIPRTSKATNIGLQTSCCHAALSLTTISWCSPPTHIVVTSPTNFSPSFHQHHHVWTQRRRRRRPTLDPKLPRLPAPSRPYNHRPHSLWSLHI